MQDDRVIKKLRAGLERRRWLGRLLKPVIYGGCGALIVLGVVGVKILNHKPDLEPWHQVDLDEEFTVDSAVTDFQGYLQLEDRLFKQLDTEIYQAGSEEGAQTVNRYQRGSRSAPEGWEFNWNRTFELVPEGGDTPRAGVLLIHGLSDSPYSLHHLGLRLQKQGAHVVGLRIPGHGTAPSGLTQVTWQDMAAAVRLAMVYLSETLGDRPLYVAGYSNGAALALQYVLTARDRQDLPQPRRLVFISPEIGVSPMARYAIWQERIGRWLGLENIYSLSHVALPFPPDDVLYGDGTGEKSPGIHLGSVALRGEKGAIQIPAAEVLRLRWNPFYSFLEDRILAHFELE